MTTMQATTTTSPFWEKFHEVAEQEQALFREQKLEEELGRCHKAFYAFIDPYTGLQKHYPYRCGHWREQLCPLCFKERQQKLQNRVRAAIDKGAVYAVSVQEAAAMDLTGELDKSDYLRLPADLEDNSEGLVLYDATNRTKRGKQILSVQDIDQETWDKITDTPEDRRPSGGLGKARQSSDDNEPSANEKEESTEWEKIHSEKILVPSEHREYAQSLYRQACLDTGGLQPTDGASLEAAIRDRNNTWVALLVAAGIPVFRRQHAQFWVCTSKLAENSWQLHNLNYGSGLDGDEQVPF